MADGRVVIDVILDDGRVTKGVANIDKSLGGLGQTARRGAAVIGKLAAALGLVYVAKKGIDLVTRSLDGAIDRYDTLNNFPRVMQQMGFDAEASEKAIQRLSDGVQGLPTRLDEVAKTTQRIAIMTGDLDGAVETTLALNNAFLASGASQADAARGLEQYVQMLAKGEVDLQSWRTLQETMGVALNDVAKAFGFAGKSAQNDLYEALKSGEITFDEFNNKLIELSNQTGGFADRARTASGGIRTAWTNLSTWIVTGVADVIGAIDEALGGTGSIESAINNLKPVIQAVFGWMAEMVLVVADRIRMVKDAIDPWLPSINEVRDGFMNVFSALQAFVMPIIQEVVSFIMNVWGQLVAWWQENGNQIMQAAQNAFQFILTIVQAVMPAVQFIIQIVWDAIKNIISGALSVIQGLIQVFTGIFTGDFSQMWEGIKKIFSGAIDLIIGWLSLSFLGGIRKILLNLLKNGVKIVQNMWKNIVNFFKNFGTNAQNLVSNMVMRVLSFFRNLFNQARNIFTSLRASGVSIWNSLRETVLNVVRGIWQGVTQRFRNMLSSVRNTMNNVRSTISNIWNRVMSFFRGINLYKVGRDIIQGLIRGIGSMAAAVWEKAKSIASGIGDTIKKALGVSSPSKLAIWIMEMVGKGLEIGGDRALPGIRKTAQKMGQTATPVPEILKLRGIKPPLGNLMPTASFATASGSASAGSPIFSRAIDNKQPAVIRLVLGRREFETYVDDITEVQDRKSYRLERFRR